MLDLSKQESGALGLFSSVLGHVGDGNFHQAVMYDPSDPAQTRAVQECVQKMVHRAVDMEGTVSVSFLRQLHFRFCFANPGAG